MVLDKSDMLALLDQFPDQCKTALSLPKGVTISGEITSIVVLGMGGSGIAGDLLQSLVKKSKLPIFVIKDYEVPNYVDQYTLVISVSYSGNTEETLAATKDAKRKGAHLLGITTGGQLKEELHKVITIPKGLQPRAALGYLFFPLVGVLYNSNLIEVSNQDLNEMIALLRKQDVLKKQAEVIAKAIQGKIPVIYASNRLAPVAYRWKTQINENAKYPAFTSNFSEMNHNEISVFQHLDRNKFVSIVLRDPHEHPRIKRRMDVSKEVMEKTTDVIEIDVQGNALIARMFSTIYLGDYTSYFLAIRERVDPTPVEVIEWFKLQIAE